MVTLENTRRKKLPSGKFMLRIERKMHYQLKALAKAQGVSLNTLVAELLGSKLKRYRATT